MGADHGLIEVDRTKAISLSPLTGHGAAQHEFFLATLTLFVLFPLGYDTFLPRRARLRPLGVRSGYGMVKDGMSKMRDGLPPVCVTFSGFGINSQPCIFRVLSGLHTVRLERQGPAACAAPPSPMAAPITPLAQGEDRVLCTVPVLSACVGRGQRSRL